MTDPNDIKGYTIGFYDPKVNDGKKQTLKEAGLIPVPYVETYLEAFHVCEDKTHSLHDLVHEHINCMTWPDSSYVVFLKNVGLMQRRKETASVFNIVANASTPDKVYKALDSHVDMFYAEIRNHFHKTNVYNKPLVRKNIYESLYKIIVDFYEKELKPLGFMRSQFCNKHMYEFVKLYGCSIDIFGHSPIWNVEYVPICGEDIDTSLICSLFNELVKKLEEKVNTTICSQNNLISDSDPNLIKSVVEYNDNYGSRYFIPNDSVSLDRMLFNELKLIKDLCEYENSAKSLIFGEDNDDFYRSEKDFMLVKIFMEVLFDRNEHSRAWTNEKQCHDDYLGITPHTRHTLDDIGDMLVINQYVENKTHELLSQAYYDKYTTTKKGSIYITTVTKNVRGHKNTVAKTIKSLFNHQSFCGPKSSAGKLCSLKRKSLLFNKGFTQILIDRYGNRNTHKTYECCLDPNVETVLELALSVKYRTISEVFLTVCPALLKTKKVMTVHEFISYLAIAMETTTSSYGARKSVIKRVLNSLKDAFIEKGYTQAEVDEYFISLSATLDKSIPKYRGFLSKVLAYYDHGSDLGFYNDSQYICHILAIYFSYFISNETEDEDERWSISDIDPIALGYIISSNYRTKSQPLNLTNALWNKLTAISDLWVRS